MDEHKSHQQLEQELAEAAKLIKVGASYQHYKDPNKIYKVLQLATQEWDDELCVVYQAQYGSGLYFVRSLKEWLDQVKWEGRPVPRFTLV